MNTPTFSEEEQTHAKIVVGRILIEKRIINFDAIDFLITGRISRLVGEGTAGISLSRQMIS